MNGPVDKIICFVLQNVINEFPQEPFSTLFLQRAAICFCNTQLLILATQRNKENMQSTNRKSTNNSKNVKQ